MSEISNKKFEDNSLIISKEQCSLIPSTVTSQERSVTFYDDHILAQKLVGDIAVASGVTFGVSPFIAIIDKAIVQRAAGTHTIVSSMWASSKSLIQRPIQFFRSPLFLMMWGVYATTFASANAIRTCVEHYEERKNHHKEGESASVITTSSASTSGNWLLLFGSTAINIVTAGLKDRAYARMFGTTGAASKMPLITYGCWATRDCMVIASGFILPDKVSPLIQDFFPTLTHADATRIAQFLCPVGVQFLAGPIQLLGLDFYNRPMRNLTLHQAVKARAKLQVEKFISIVGARIARIAPGYGIGGIGNTYFRDSWRSMISKNQRQWQ